VTNRLLGGSAAWPIAAHAQQPERMRRIGVLMPATADDPDFQARVGAFLQALALLGFASFYMFGGRSAYAPTSVVSLRCRK
jgi:hypothetical protein